MAVKIIFGGNFINKGAEAMAYTMADMLRKKYPNDEPVLLDLFPSRFGAEQLDIPFRIVNMHVRTLFRLQFPILKLLFKPSPKSASEKEIKALWKEATGFYDISGYGVSSHNQSPMWTLATIFPALWAQRRNIPVFLMPQSLGPFQYNGWKKWILQPLVKRYLQIPKTIFIREAISRKHLAPFRKKDIEDSLDLVLLHPAQHAHVENSEKSLALIPNKQLTKFKPLDEVATTFASIAEQCMQKGYTVHLLAHASDDHTLNKAIYNKIANKNMTIWYRDSLSVPETENILAQMDGVVTARYHGLVHALKAGKPSLVIGWAHKYEALLETMHLKQYYTDCSSPEQWAHITQATTMWLEKGLLQGTEIAQRVAQLQKTSKLMQMI